MEQTLVAPRGISPEQTEDHHIERAWWGVVAVFLVHGLVVSTWVARIAAVKTGLRLSDGQLGLALLGSAIGSMTAIPLSGWAVARFGSARSVLWTSIGFALTLILLGFSWNSLTLFLALTAYGAFAGANDVSMNAHAVGVEKRLGRPTMSRFHAMFSLGGIIGASVGALIASAHIAPSTHLATAAIAIVAGILLARTLLVDTGNVTLKKGHMSRRPPRALIVLSAIGFCIFLSEGAIADWTTVYIREILHAGEGMAAAGYAVFSAAMTVFRFVGDDITARLGRAWTIRAGGLLAALGMAIVVFAQSPYVAFAGFAAAGAGFSSIIPVVFAAGGRIPSMPEAAGVATVSGLGYLGFLVGPPMIGFVSEMTSLRGGLFVLVVLSTAAALLVRVVERDSRDGASPLAD